MDANSRKEGETQTGEVQNRKLPSGMHSKGERANLLSTETCRLLLLKGKLISAAVKRSQARGIESSDQTAQLLYF